MYKTIATICLAVLMTISFNAIADNRAETKNTCHFAPDPADDDNEVYASVCENSIETYDAGDGNGRLAYTETWAYRDYIINDGAFPKSVGAGNIARRGADADPDKYSVWTDPNGGEIQYIETPNTNCASVTHNYNNGDNYTVYNSNDYNVEYWWTGARTVGTNVVARLNFHMVCRAGAAQ